VLFISSDVCFNGWEPQRFSTLSVSSRFKDVDLQTYHIRYRYRCLITRGRPLPVSDYTWSTTTGIWLHVVDRYQCLITRGGRLPISDCTWFTVTGVWLHVVYRCRCL